jgi:hypothetical protein
VIFYYIYEKEKDEKQENYLDPAVGVASEVVED